MLMELDDLITILDDAVDMQDNGKYQDALDNFYRDGILHDLKRYLNKQAKRVQELEEKIVEAIDENGSVGDRKFMVNQILESALEGEE